MLQNCGSAALHRRMRKKSAPLGDFTQKKLTQAIYHVHTRRRWSAQYFKSAWDLKIRNVPNLLFDAVDVFPADDQIPNGLLKILFTILISI